ncbi:DUF262 domain-containing protein [Campylobacter coli]
MNNKVEIKSISNKEKYIVAKDIFFEIPPYQRLYEWNKEQIQTLLNDIKTKFEENKNEEYFIGNVVVSKKNNKNNQQDVKYLLIDGQQRLTTLFLIGFYLSYKIKNPNNDSNWKEFIMQGDKLRISMPIRENEEEVLKRFARFCNESKSNEKNNLFVREIKKFPQDICQNISQALETIANWFEENAKDDIANFSNFIYNNVKFVFVELAQNTDLNRFFIRMNNRGKQLEKHEILKARLLKNISDEERILYAHIWDICSQMDNYIFQKASDRKISKLNESNENTIDTIDTIINRSLGKPNQDEEKQEKFKSIVDFPTFLLHVYKICNKQDITIDKNKLLEIIKIEDSQKEKKAKDFIENLLKYRILFDYFIVKGKDDKENSYKIRRLDEEGKKFSKDFDDLAMVQNYLRVARIGLYNNYHHWLTPFLKFINNDKLKISYERVNNEDKPEELQIKIGDYNITTDFQCFLNKLNLNEKGLINFLENLDTALAKEQASAEEIKKDLLGISNDILDQLKIKNDQIDAENIFFIEDENGISVLDQGTATPHYWFYRLEYYLWKYSKIKYYLDGKNLKEIKLKDKNFGDIANNFYFRNLNSIEHVQAQSKANEKDWDDKNIDNFGNLALISPSFNSSLSNLDTQDKYLYINKDNNIISLKLWLIYALSEKNQLNWTFNKAQEHRRQMLEILKKSFNNEHDKA